MTARLTLLCHAPTAATRTGAFPADEPIETPAAEDIASLKTRLPPFDRIVAAPSLRTRQTAELFGTATAVDEIGDLNVGRWTGLRLAEVAEAEAEALQQWLTDPAAAPHGGEAVTQLIGRVGSWLAVGPTGRRVLGVTHAAVMRAAVIHILDAPPDRFWRIDAAPLSILQLTHDGRRWALRL